MDSRDTPTPLMELVSAFGYSDLEIVEQRKESLVSDLKEIDFNAGDFLHEIQYDDLNYSDVEYDVDIDFECSRLSNTPETSQQRCAPDEEDMPELTIDPSKVDLSGSSHANNFSLASIYQPVYSNLLPSSPVGLGRFDTSYSAFPDDFLTESPPETPISYRGSPAMDTSPVEAKTEYLDASDDNSASALHSKSRITLKIPVKLPHRPLTQPGGKLVCEVENCGKQFKNRALLSRHINCVHLHLERYVCEFCHRKFTRSDHMKIHVGRMHQNKNGDSRKRSTSKTRRKR
ncbi:hypothetical protein KL935_003111 [Ogataea polymorpha]|uniref:uncharacterized protein n=1 Tax=Ogataea polymorpha TaxID=460523 RepID=UPI0007F360CA|nr:uncharacterized protein OGAPODRAFT_12161 [Ogataea polymorpha]KAG7879459.1 hypothetical protein KL937_003220 [Ogataea polymorpha]KAG7892521.1 hypothetical protein KL908_003473 [Ogataea polymorpha]KAG7900368.1 hypothetical protein KL935_003111 [Ogataea polymorpha]KAG7909296.1 hypothetical protein KL906_002790 [Ogataea polymorpha]KAG7915970.1 hypothetical protein KL927_003435 [Ogataea polymorpha]